MNDVIKFEANAMVHVLLAERKDSDETLREIYETLRNVNGCTLETGKFVHQAVFRADSIDSANIALKRFDWYMTPIPKEQLVKALTPIASILRHETTDTQEIKNQKIDITADILTGYPADLVTIGIRNVSINCLYFPQPVGFLKTIKQAYAERTFIRKLIIKEIDRLQ